jgi:hypothetical protein
MGSITPRMFAGHDPDASGSCPYECERHGKGGRSKQRPYENQRRPIGQRQEQIPRCARDDRVQKKCGTVSRRGGR